MRVGADAYIRPKNIPNRDDVGIVPYDSVDRHTSLRAGSR